MTKTILSVIDNEASAISVDVDTMHLRPERSAIETGGITDIILPIPRNG